MTRARVSKEALRAMSAQAPNLRYLMRRGKQLAGKYGGRFVVVADGGRLVQAFASRSEARDFRDQLEPSLREGAVIDFIDDPMQAYLI